MSDEPEKPKIISFGTRKPFVPAETDAPKEPAVNPHVEMVLDHFGELNAEGHVGAIAVIAWDTHAKRWQRAVVVPVDKEEQISNQALTVIGGLELLRGDLIGIAAVDYFADEDEDDDE